MEFAAEIGDGAARIVVARLAFAVAAERLKFSSDLRAGPPRIFNTNLAIEDHFIQYFFFARWQEQFRFDFCGTAQDRRIGIRCETQNVLNAGVRSADVED